MLSSSADEDEREEFSLYMGISVKMRKFLIWFVKVQDAKTSHTLHWMINALVVLHFVHFGVTFWRI